MRGFVEQNFSSASLHSGPLRTWVLLVAALEVQPSYWNPEQTVRLIVVREAEARLSHSSR